MMTSFKSNTKETIICIPSDSMTLLNYFILMSEPQPPTPPININHQHDQTALAKRQDEDSHEMGEITHWGYFLLFSYLYIIQGVVSGFASTMPYIYTELPDVSTMAIFNSSNLPFSLKFLIAPFLQKFSCVLYGKRKTWFMFSLLFTGGVVFLSSFFTSGGYANLFAVLCIVAQVGMAILDISVHAAMIKELRSAAQASVILCYSQNVGNIVGSFFMLKLTSLEFAQSIGLSSPITSPQIFLMIYAGFLLVPGVLVHFKFKERILESEKRGSRFTFCEIISYYKVFLSPASRYFRLCVYFLICQVGFNFFNSLYDYNLVQAGFSRDTANDISNIIIFPVIVCTFFFARWTVFVGGKSTAVIIASVVLLVLMLYYLIVFPLEPWIIFVTSLVQNIASTWVFFIGAWMVNDFPPNALTGMFITLCASFANLGQLTSLQTIICGELGWKLCSFVGLGIQAIIVLFTPMLFEWMKEGNSHVPPEIEEAEGEEEPLEQDISSP